MLEKLICSYKVFSVKATSLAPETLSENATGQRYILKNPASVSVNILKISTLQKI